MKNKIFFIAVLIVLLLSMITPNTLSAPPFTEITQVQTGLTIATSLPNAIKQNTSRDFYIHVQNNTRLITNFTTCWVHIYDEQYTGEQIAVLNSSVATNFDYEVVANANNFTRKGLYSFKAFCNTSTETGIYERNFYVTKNGNEPGGDTFMEFIYLMFIIAIIGLIYTFFMNLAKVSTLTINAYDVVLSWGFWVLSLIVVHLSENYLINTYVEDIMIFFNKITIWSNVIIPIMMLAVAMIIRGKLKRPLTNREIGGRFS